MSAPIVLISPAMGIGSGYYRPVVEAFESHGWRAQALKRRGFERGQPQASRRENWSYRDEIDDIAAAVATARTEKPDRPVLLLGHSLGGQLAAGHEVRHPTVDGVITVGGSVPYYRYYPHRGIPLAIMAGLIVPMTTAALGYVPKPAFGGPGARTLMREWARMIMTGRPPFNVDSKIQTPAFIVSLGGDQLAPKGAVDRLAGLFEADNTTRWHYDEVPEGASSDHIAWVRTPVPVVERVVKWWAETA